MNYNSTLTKEAAAGLIYQKLKTVFNRVLNNMNREDAYTKAFIATAGGGALGALAGDNIYDRIYGTVGDGNYGNIGTGIGTAIGGGLGYGLSQYV